MIPIPNLDFLGYGVFLILGILIIIMGLVPMFPNISSKVLKKEVKSAKKQKTASVLLFIIGAVFIVLAFVA